MFSLSKKLLLTMTACTVVLSLLLVACGGRSYDKSSESFPQASSSMAMVMDGEAGSPSAKPPTLEGMGMQNNGDTAANATPKATVSSDVAERKLVRNGNLALETKEFDASLEAITKLVTELGGYIDSQAVSGNSIRRKDGYFERSATISARVPADKLNGFTTRLSELCNVLSQAESVDDISDRYYDAQSRLEVLKIKEARLLELLAKAEQLEDIIKLEDALSNCQYELDSLTGQLRRMDNQVSYSTVAIELYEVVEYNDVKAPPKTFGEKMGEALQSSGKRLVRSVQGVLLNVVELGPVTVLYLAFWIAVLFLCFRLYKRLRKGKASKHKQPQSIPDPIVEQKATNPDKID